VRGEVLLPQAGGKKVDVEGRMGIDTLEYIDEVDIGIDPLQAARGDQALDNADIPGAHFCPAKEPVAPA